MRKLKVKNIPLGITTGYLSYIALTLLLREERRQRGVRTCAFTYCCNAGHTQA